MKTVDFRGVRVVIDPDRTRETYKAIAANSSDLCTCSFCLNFRALGASPFPQDVLSFFELAGIDHLQPAETYEYNKTAAGNLYGGEFYFFGNAPFKGCSELHSSGPFDCVFTSPSPLAQEEFQAEGTVCLCFVVELPWVIVDEPN